jgi:putative ABC transport system permease protein
MKTLFRRLLHLLRLSRHDGDLREEMETHRSLRQDALERNGLEPQDAAHASRRAMGNVPLVFEDAREVWAMRVVAPPPQEVLAAVR